MNGYVKIWRKEQDSEIWGQSPELYKFWHWILLNVDRHDATLRHSSGQIIHALKMPTIDHQQKVKKMLTWLENNGMISVSLYGSGRKRGYQIVVNNWDRYQENGRDGNVTGNGRETDGESIEKINTYDVSRDGKRTGNGRERDGGKHYRQEERSTLSPLPPTKSERGEEGFQKASVVHAADYNPLALSNSQLLDPLPDFDHDALMEFYRAEKETHNRRYDDATVHRAIYALHCDPTMDQRLGMTELRSIIAEWMRSGYPFKPNQLWHPNPRFGNAPYWEVNLELGQRRQSSPTHQS